MVFQTSVEDPAPMVSFGSNVAYIPGQSGGITTYLCLTWTHGLHDFFTGLSSLFHLLFHWEPGAFIFHLFH